MLDISQVVDVQITASPAGTPRTGFGVGLILGTFVSNADRARQYNNLSALQLDHGVETEVYKAAAKYFGASPSPRSVIVGRRQVDVVDINITVVNNFEYSVVIDGEEFTYTSGGAATEQQIIDGLIGEITGVPVTPTDGGVEVLRLTANPLKTGFSVSVGENLALAALSAAYTIADDLAAIKLVNNSWYALILTDRDPEDMLAAIAWIQTQRKILFAASEEANIVDQAAASDTTTLAALFKSNSYGRGGVFYHEDAEADYPDAAYAGKLLTYVPGGYNPAYKPLVGIEPSSLTENQVANAIAKNANVYVQMGANQVTYLGTMGDGTFIDRIHGRDKLLTRIEENIFAAIAAVAKVPYTEAGVAIIESGLRAALDEAVQDGFLASYTIQLPKVSEVSSVDRANRLLPDVLFSAIEAGAINKVEIRGTVSV